MINKFYKDKIKDTLVKDTIYKSNADILFYIITDYYKYTKDSTRLKKKIRKKFPNKEDKKMNYIHASDTPEEASKEISILKNYTKINLT